MHGQGGLPTERLFEAAVEQVYGAALDPQRWPAALQAVADMSGDMGSILIYSRDDGTFGIIETESLRYLTPDYRDAWSGRDIRAIRSLERGYFFQRDVITDDDVLTDAEMDSDPFYTEFLAPRGLKYFAAAMVSPDPHVEVALSVQRRLGRPKFSPDETARLRRLGPHIENALRISVRLMDAELTKLSLGDALGRIGIGVFALDSLGRITFSNAAGDRLIGDGLAIVDGRLRAMQKPDGATHESRAPIDLSSPHDGDGAKPFLIRGPQSGRAIALYILPVSHRPSVEEQFLTHARVLVLAVMLDRNSPPEPALVRDLLGLTLAEARVASLIGSGLAPRAAAQKLAISEETARTVLKRVFAKTGVSRQSELAAMMGRLMLR